VDSQSSSVPGRFRNTVTGFQPDTWPGARLQPRLADDGNTVPEEIPKTGFSAEAQQELDVAVSKKAFEHAGHHSACYDVRIKLPVPFMSASSPLCVPVQIVWRGKRPPTDARSYPRLHGSRKGESEKRKFSDLNQTVADMKENLLPDTLGTYA